ncbi:MAG: efflux RND transporter periplasmic adaptor subunit [Candidatus Shapirobacteria bacterium]|jgi:macrolide-specific efflux system membrane fusion protein
MKINKKVKIAVIVAVVLILGIVIFTKIKSSQSSKPQYNTSVAEKGTLIVSLTSSGQVAATNSRTVTTTASGVVSKVYVKEGQKVSTGTPIMLITLDMDGQQQLQSAYAQLQSAQNNLVATQNKIYSLDSSLTSTKNIFNNQWASISPDDPGYIQAHDNLLSAQANYDALKSQVAQAQSSLISAQMSYRAASATVYAPISGTVSAISLAPGMVLNPTSNSNSSSNVSNKIAIVKTSATPAISVLLTEIDVPKVKVGDQATITLDALPNKSYTGKVIAVDTSGTVSSGVVSYTTTIKLDADAPDILSNMSATANIITDVEDGVIMVPVSAVQTASDGTTTVRELKNGQLTSIPVEVGNSNTTQTIISSGVNEGDTVITGIVSSTTTKTSSTTSTSVFGSSRGGFGAALGR